MLWWHSWTWWFGTYQWLEANNLWKATVAFWVTILLSVALTATMRPWRAWKKHRATQEKIADRLDTSTPGGITDLVHALREVLDSLEEGDAPDDNGTDDDPLQRRKKGHGSGHRIESERNDKDYDGPLHPPGPHIPGIQHGGGSAGHR